MKTLAQLMCELPGARVVGDAAHAGVLRVHTDTRSLRPGDLFVALRGERFDAHDFLSQVATRGAAAVVADGAASAASGAASAAASCADARPGTRASAAAVQTVAVLPKLPKSINPTLSVLDSEAAKSSRKHP